VRLFNTLSRRIEELAGGRDVSLYVCGVTPYDTTHVGHARTYLVFDILVRALLAGSRRVRYVQNITDVDDSILARAAELGISYEELHERYTGIYMDDIAALGMVPAMEYPRATSVIAEMQEVIRRLVASGHAYQVDGDVFFRVASTPHFGALSRLDRNGMVAIEATQDAPTLDDARKEDPLDFPLWKSSRPGEPRWNSPWGAGRPGWHIECSTLVLKHLGPQIDIHGGGSDLVYPHHESEIVQSEAVTGVRPFSRTWVHVEMVRLGGHKMSKSDGNLVFVRDLLGRYTPDALRLYLLATHYRAPLDFHEGELVRWAEGAARVAAAARAPVVRAAGGVDPAPSRAAFEAAIENDLDTATAIEALSGLAGDVLEAAEESRNAFHAQRALRIMGSRLGLQLEPPRA
jgi:L-cysteine:1D-myo-inositol 2-amino-2-deoxy-alpha-D-glucopyranoside ligase